MRATWLLGGTGALFLGSAAFGAPFSFQPVLSDESPLPDGLTLENIFQVVTAADGVVISHAQADGEQYVFKTVAGVTTYVAAPDAGYAEFREVAVSPSGTISFEARNPSGDFALVQTPLAGGPLVRLDSNGTNIGGEPFEQNHYQVNDVGVAVYKFVNAGVQSFSTAAGATTHTTVAEGDIHGVKNFNLPTADVPYRRQVVTHDGSVVFYAEAVADNTPGLYRLNSTGDISQISVSGISFQSTVVGASDNAVLYTTLTTPEASPTVHLNLKVGAGNSIELTNYVPTLAEARVSNAVMTPQNRIAFFDPGSASNSASLKYYDASHGVVTIISEQGGSVFDDANNQFTLKQLSIDDQKRTNPMVNDHGIVVFDAILNPTASPTTDVQAILEWDVDSQQLKIVIKSDGGGEYSDDYGGGKVLGLAADVLTNQAGDVLKGSLSEDNRLSFVLAYTDSNDVEHFGIGMVQVPEPTTASAVGLAAAGLLLRRRRRQNCKAN